MDWNLRFRSCGLTLLLFACWLAVARPAWGREAPRVWIVPASASAEDEALARRLAAELAGQGLAVSRPPAGTRHDGVPALLSTEVSAAVWVDARARRTEVWIAGRPSHDREVKQVLESDAPGHAGVLALRTVELVRAMLAAPTTSAPPGRESRVRPGAPARATATRGDGVAGGAGPAAAPGAVSATRNSPPLPPAPTEGADLSPVPPAASRASGAASAPPPPARGAVSPTAESPQAQADLAPPRPPPDEGPPVAPEQPATSAPAVLPPPEKTSPVTSSEPTSPPWSPSHAQLALSPAVLAAQGALGPWFGGTLRLAVALPKRFFLAVEGFGSPQHARASAMEGSASVSVFAARLGLGRIFLSTSRLRVDGALGTGILGLTASGESPTFDRVAATDFTVGLSAHAEVGLELRLAGRFSLRAEVMGGWLYRRPVMVFDASEVTAVGRGLLLGALGVQVSF